MMRFEMNDGKHVIIKFKYQIVRKKHAGSSLNSKKF